MVIIVPLITTFVVDVDKVVNIEAGITALLVLLVIVNVDFKPKNTDAPIVIVGLPV
jgi:hypothetical protein